MLCWQMHTFCRQLRIVHETWGKALPEDAKVKLRKDECAFSMRRHGQKRNVAVEWRVHKYTLEKCSMKHMHKHYRQRRSVYEYEAWGVTNPKKLCSHEGCANLAINGGVYMKHKDKAMQQRRSNRRKSIPITPFWSIAADRLSFPSAFIRIGVMNELLDDNHICTTFNYHSLGKRQMGQV